MKRPWILIGSAALSLAMVLMALVPLNASIFGEILSVFSGSLRPPQSTVRVGGQEVTFNGVPATVTYYRNGMKVDDLIGHYKKQASDHGWKEAVEGDLVGAMTGLSGASRDLAHGRFDVTSFKKGVKSFMVGVMRVKAESTGFVVVESKGDMRDGTASPEPGDPLSPLMEIGASKVVFERQVKPAEHRSFASLYRLLTVPDKAQAHIRKKLESENWHCLSRYDKANGKYWISFNKGASSGLACFYPDPKGQTVAMAWGELN